MNSARIEIHRHRPEQGASWLYEDLDRRQREVLGDVIEGHPGRLLLSEVAPVISFGVRDSKADLLLEEEAYRARGISLYGASRGGRATYHGPGQWLAFPVESLERLTGDRKGVRRVTDLLLGAALEVARTTYATAEIRSGPEAGVWSDAGRAGGKVAALGLRFTSGVLQHGLSLNIHRTPESFHGLRPCGLDAPVAYLGQDGGEKEFVLYGERLSAALLRFFPTFAL